MSRNVTLSLAMIGAAVLLLVGFLFFTGDKDEPTPTAAPSGTAGAAMLVRDDSPRLSQGGDAVFVEFLDFECEACLALHPVIEDLRTTYGDRVTFVIRHMPLHRNSVDAALAAEAAADQGKFEAMYQRLFQTAQQWRHQEASQRDVFFTYAKELGLDMERFTASYDDEATLRRIEQSKQDGRAAGVTGTPTFFLDGTLLQPQSIAELREAVDAAVRD